MTTTFAGVNVESGKVDLSTLSFPVEKQPVFNKDGSALEHFELVRRLDTGATLSVVSKQYSLITHQEALFPILEKVGQEWTVTRARVDRGGAQAYVELINKTCAEEVLKQDAVYPRVMLTNSYDRSTSVKIMYGAYRLVCLNGLTMPVAGSGSFSFRSAHMGDVADRLTSISNNLDAFKTSFKNLVGIYSTLTDRAVDPETAAEVVSDIVGKRNSGRVLWNWTHGRGQSGSFTAWALYNGLTEYLTHDYKGAEANVARMSDALLDKLVSMSAKRGN